MQACNMIYCKVQPYIGFAGYVLMEGALLPVTMWSLKFASSQWNARDKGHINPRNTFTGCLHISVAAFSLECCWKGRMALGWSTTDWRCGVCAWNRIDAIMRQLITQGWMHHLARHSVACFLTRGDLYCSWEAGRDVFDRCSPTLSGQGFSYI